MKELRRFQARVDALRADLDFSPPGVIWMEDSDNGMIVVEADGFGSATTSIVEGNYPVDYCRNFEKRFATEKDAESAAVAIAAGKVSPSTVLCASAGRETT
jgi:hypothetical protein